MSKVKFEEHGPDTYSDTAAELVNSAINDAIVQLEKHFAEEMGFSLADLRKESYSDTMKHNEKEFSDLRPATPLLIEKEQTNKDIPNIEWMTIDKFGKELAEAKISEFINNTWKYGDSWLYCIDYLGEKEEKYDMRYNFRVRWSIPTRRKPIPRATASVYFTFSVSKIKPGDYPVDVYYVFETYRLVHRPGKSIFREKWLKDVIESKIQLYETITF